MSGDSHSIYLLGPAQQTAGLAAAMGDLPCTPTCYQSVDALIGAALSAPPWAVVVWDTGSADDLETSLEVLLHHGGTRRCALVLVRGGGQETALSESVSRAVLETRGPAEEILGLLRECCEAGGAPGGGIARIMVVDDDQTMVLLGSHIVSGMGMIPLVAFDGPEAVEKARRFHPDLILLDINMPGMDGFQVIEALKADSSTSLIPIVVFSARVREQDKVRALDLGADDYVTKPFSINELSARMDRLLKRTRTGVSASSTTGLPGSVSLEQVIVERIHTREPLAVLYLDADHFKAFNDRYGFFRGDGVIRQIADLILTVVQAEGNENDFVGHIGGDDFVVVTTPERADTIAESVIERFDRLLPYYYDPEDRQAGYIATEDRKGRRERFPLMTLSVAVVTTETRDYQHPGELADVAAQLKKYAKAQPGSVWVKDQRSNSD